MSADETTREHRTLVLESRAIGVLAARLRLDRNSAWERASDAERRAFARAVLAVRRRVNRVGLLRWRVVRAEGERP